MKKYEKNEKVRRYQTEEKRPAERSRPTQQAEIASVRQGQYGVRNGETEKTKQRLAGRHIALGGCGLMLISMFMPFVKMTFIISFNISYISTGDGKIALVLIIAAIALLWLKKIKIAAVPLALAAAMGIYNAVYVLADEEIGDFVSPHIGFFFYLIGAIVAGVGVFIAVQNAFGEKGYPHV